MKFPHFFIERPIFATVLSFIIVLVGGKVTKRVADIGGTIDGVAHSVGIAGLSGSTFTISPNAAVTFFDFARMYQGRPPWDIGKPQTAFVDVADQIQGSVLDVGCGTGENAIFFAKRGHKVTGLDFLERPLQIARQKAAERGIDVEFIQYDALRFDERDRQFDNVLDSGLFHGLSDEDRIRYVAAIGRVVVPDGKLFLQCFSDQEPVGEGPRRVSETEIRESFKNGWQIVSIKPTRFVVRDDTELNFSDGGPKAWLCVVKRVSKETVA